MFGLQREFYMVQKTYSNETLTVATGGRGYLGTTAAAHDVVTGTYSSSGTSVL